MKKKILIVDDEENIAFSLNSLINFKYKEFDTKSFSGKSCGHDTMKWLDKNKPDLSVVDVLLNGISGLDIAKKINILNPDGTIYLMTGCVNSSKEFKDAKALSEKNDKIFFLEKDKLAHFLTNDLSEVLGNA